MESVHDYLESMYGTHMRKMREIYDELSIEDRALFLVRFDVEAQFRTLLFKQTSCGTKNDILGKYVVERRSVLDLTQDNLVGRLNNKSPRAIDPYTKREKKYSRSWLSKLEAGFLRRAVSIDVRGDLLGVLGGSEVEYSVFTNLYH